MSKGNIELVAGAKIGTIGKKPPKRLAAQAKPNAPYEKLSAGDTVQGPVVPKRQPPPPMSTPKCLLEPTSEAGKERAKKAGGTNDF